MTAFTSGCLGKDTIESVTDLESIQPYTGIRFSSRARLVDGWFLKTPMHGSGVYLKVSIPAEEFRSFRSHKQFKRLYYTDQRKFDYYRVRLGAEAVKRLSPPSRGGCGGLPSEAAFLADIRSDTVTVYYWNHN